LKSVSATRIKPTSRAFCKAQAFIGPEGVQSKLHEPSELEVKSLLEAALKAKL